jgi:glycine hydroxymethyltransferase
MFLVDLRPKHITGKDAEAVLERAYITVNKNAIPNDPEKPFVTSGIRLGTPAITTRGLREAECEELAHWIADVLENPQDAANIVRVRGAVLDLCHRFPVYATPAAA